MGENIAKRIITYLVIIIGIIGAFWLGRTYHNQEPKDEFSASVIREKVVDVLKLETQEVYLSEVFTFENSKTYALFGMQKKVIIKVKGVAHLGYDLEDINIDIDHDHKTIRIHNLEDAFGLLSLEHDVEFYDVQTGIFNSLTEEDLTLIEQKAKQKLEDAVVLSPSYENLEITSEKRVKDLFSAFGFEVIIEEGEMHKN